MTGTADDGRRREIAFDPPVPAARPFATDTGMREMRSALRESLERAVRDDSCGCAMGARFMMAALVVAAPTYAWRYHEHALGAWPAAWRVFACLFLATGVGKGLGLLLHRRLARRAPRQLTAAPHR